MPRMVVIGALVYDLVFEVDDWVQPNAAVHARQLTLSPGGKGLNQAVAASRLGACEPRLLGCVGKDVYGAQMLAALRAEGVCVRYVRQHPRARTSIAAIIVQDKLPAFVGAPDASRRLNKAQLQAGLADLQAGDLLLLGFEVPQPLIPFALELAKAAGAITVMNPAPFFTHEYFALPYLHMVDMLIPNIHEAQSILQSDNDDPQQLAEDLLARGVSQVVITMGEAGSLYMDSRGSRRQRAYRLDTVDTTGASDAFVGALCHCLVQGWATAHYLDFASAAAALCCSRPGTMSALPTAREVQALQREYRGTPA